MYQAEEDEHRPTLFIMSTPTLQAVLFAVLASLFVSARCENQSWKGVALFVLGDSINDAGTNNYINTTAGFRANFPPYGETFFRIPTGRFSDGRLIVDFIAEYANLPLIPPYLQMKDDEFMGGANFASGGAGALVGTSEGYVVDLKTQLKQLEQLEKKLRKEMGSEKAKRIIKDGVYLISIGTNDYGMPLSYPALFQSISMEDYVGMVIGNITTVLKGIYEVGGRKFAMIGVGQFGCAPSGRASTRNGSCSVEANNVAKLHNVALTSVLTKLEIQLQGFEYSYFDYYTSGSKRFQYPSKYGFKEGQIACCGSGPYRGNFTCGGQRGVKEYSLCHHPDKYVFFDSGHSSERANRQYAQLMWNGNLSVVGPRNVKAFFKHEGA
ncbi:GDSL esterase/lipase 1-like [Rhodamnia argentea]|uniref:GDSL esterase/lipase 1-like n=1 Tax=Rhodamnia argentea TaxID=178133 RepID=A0A8B8NMW7_9MYRT|nr:GDSL esterase/lipase 1-like [Rhodamnia argentea]